MKTTGVLAAMAAGVILLVLLVRVMLPAIAGAGDLGDEVQTLIDIIPLVMIAALVLMLGRALAERRVRGSSERRSASSSRSPVSPWPWR